MNLAGNTVRKEHVLLLAALVDGELAAKLNRALIYNNTIVALSPADCEHVLAVLGETPPGGLLGAPQRAHEAGRQCAETRRLKSTRNAANWSGCAVKILFAKLQPRSMPSEAVASRASRVRTTGRATSSTEKWLRCRPSGA
jgi:hypothetical protein